VTTANSKPLPALPSSRAEAKPGAFQELRRIDHHGKELAELGPALVAEHAARRR